MPTSSKTTTTMMSARDRSFSARWDERSGTATYSVNPRVPLVFGSTEMYFWPSVALYVSVLVGAEPVGAAGTSVEGGLPTTYLVAPLGPRMMM